MLLTKGVLTGVCTMRDGELSRFTVQSKYAFADKGCPELNIPPNATLVLEIRMLEFHNVSIVLSMYVQSTQVLAQTP